MTKDQIIAMAREAGITFKPMIIDGDEYDYRHVSLRDSIGGDEAGCIELFAQLVAAQAAAEEREKADQDAKRYRALRKTLHGAVGGGVEVNDEKLVYQEAEPGEAVRLYWYPVTPVGFYECKADTLDEAVDQLLDEGRWS